MCYMLMFTFGQKQMVRKYENMVWKHVGVTTGVSHLEQLVLVSFCKGENVAKDESEMVNAYLC